VLERSGWRFVRIRGSQFFRDPDAAMKHVFETLFEFGILPEGSLEPAQPAQTTSDLVHRVRRRASEILRQKDEPLEKRKRDKRKRKLRFGKIPPWVHDKNESSCDLDGGVSFCFRTCAGRTE
jgi:hypothetical protein